MAKEKRIPKFISNLLPTVYDKKTPKQIVSDLPKSGRVSKPYIASGYADIKDSLEFITPDFQYEFIPTIRKLLKVNSSVSSAVTGIAELANTGFEVDYGATPADIITKANKHLEIATKHWGIGTPGLHGLVNKIMYQVYIGGAMSVEWVLKTDLTGIKYMAMVNPEQVRAAYDYGDQAYRFFQVPRSFSGAFAAKTKGKETFGYIELNPFTYQYLGLISDEESPVGIPPILSALDDLATQLRMLRNIGFVSDQMGLMGFLEILMAKPSRNDAEGDEQYTKRLVDILTQAKTNIAGGLKDGIVAGYQDDHEFDFHTPNKDSAGAAEIFGIIQRMVSTGLFTDAQFLGGLAGASETLVTVIFTKMLSQLHNIQTFASAIISRGIWLELTMNGFNVDKIDLKWNPSTMTDKVKEAQAEELRVRNNRVMYADGIQDIDSYARSMGFEKADQREPRAEINPDKVVDDAMQKEKDQKVDNKSDRNSRAKKKDQPKGKDTK